MVVLPLQWFSVLVEWIEILFLAIHPSSSNYCMIIFSPTTIGWKLHFILSKKRMVGRVALAIVFGPDGMD